MRLLQPACSAGPGGKAAGEKGSKFLWRIPSATGLLLLLPYPTWWFFLGGGVVCFLMKVAIFISGSLLGVFLYFFFFFFLLFLFWPHRQYVGIPGPGIEATPHSSNPSHSGENTGASIH